MGNISPALQKETKNVTLSVLIGTVAMWIVFAILHAALPAKVPFDYRVILGGLGGGAVAVLNFFLMGLTIQKVTSTDDEKLARNFMKASYTRRMVMQGLWMIVAIAAPCFQFVAGLVPLLFPGAGIKIRGLLGKI